MIKMTDIQARAAEAAIARNIPFALFALPDSREARFFAARPDNDDAGVWKPREQSAAGTDSFFINFFNNDEAYTAAVGCDFATPEDFLEYADANPAAGKEPGEHLQTLSTDRTIYLAYVDTEIRRLKRRKGKTVLSRMEVLGSPRRVVDIARDLFAGFSNTFRYLCFTRETGLWLGATPELLLKVAADDPATMLMRPLAGTLPADAKEWDRKNINEHTFVVADIADIISRFAANDVKCSVRTCEVPFGNIKHRATEMRLQLSVDDYREFLTALSPTAAVGGSPRDEAIRRITELESHERKCYAGFVGVQSGRAIDAYVNLRCAMARQNADGSSDFNIFGGGGITAESVAAQEWEETEAKITPLREIINKPTDYNE